MKELAIWVTIALACVLVVPQFAQASLDEAKDMVSFKAYQDTAQMMQAITTVQKDVFMILGFADSGAKGVKIQAFAKENQQPIGKLKLTVAGVAKGQQLSAQERNFFFSALKDIEEYEAVTKR